jgi:hypothetical protein
MEKKEKVEALWSKFEQYKETAEQHEFLFLLMLDKRLTLAYNDLKNNWNEEHADIFIRTMENVIKTFGI